MFGNGGKWQDWLDMAGRPETAGYDLKWLKMAGNDRKWLEKARIAGNG